jgi:hypothetical protein
MQTASMQTKPGSGLLAKEGAAFKCKDLSASDHRVASQRFKQLK